ncbi:Cell division control protein 7, partial [Coemansia biformis]
MHGCGVAITEPGLGEHPDLPHGGARTGDSGEYRCEADAGGSVEQTASNDPVGPGEVRTGDSGEYRCEADADGSMGPGVGEHPDLPHGGARTGDSDENRCEADAGGSVEPTASIDPVGPGEMLNSGEVRVAAFNVDGSDGLGHGAQASELGYCPSDAEAHDDGHSDHDGKEGDSGDDHAEQEAEGAGHSGGEEGGEEEEGDEDEDEGEEALEEIRELEELIPGLSDQYRLLGRIGEGTFSTVYKAIDLRHEHYDNSSWTMIFDDSSTAATTAITVASDNGGGGGDDNDDARRERPRGAMRRARVVAIKKIYVTSSPARIANEISILDELRGSRFVAPLVTAMRRGDQVVVVLPYFRNDDFRRFYLDLPVGEVRWYLASLLNALKYTHEKGIMHRDIKPSNFLYDVDRRHGVLVDFGLAEREGDQEATRLRSRRSLHMDSSTAARLFRSFDQRGRPGVPRKDTRPALRANRAGTRGFRAPEVLLKIPQQSVAIDIWSAGVILLCLLTRRFPFFQSVDDTEALLEISVLYGRLEMERAVAELGRTFFTNIPTVKDRGIRFESLAKAYNPEGYPCLPPDVFDLLRRLLALDPGSRITAADALNHPF